MDMTREYLHIHGKVPPVNRTYRNTVVNVMCEESPTICDSSATVLVRNEEYHKQVNPTLNMLRLLGMLPLGMPSDGKLHVNISD
jgi:hypothetical protein